MRRQPWVWAEGYAVRVAHVAALLAFQVMAVHGEAVSGDM